MAATMVMINYPRAVGIGQPHINDHNIDVRVLRLTCQKRREFLRRETDAARIENFCVANEYAIS